MEQDIEWVARQRDAYMKAYLEAQQKYFELEKKKAEEYASLINVEKLQDNSVYLISVGEDLDYITIDAFAKHLQEGTKGHNISWVLLHPNMKITGREDKKELEDAVGSEKIAPQEVPLVTEEKS